MIGELHLDNAQVLELLQTRRAERASLIVARRTSEALEQICFAMDAYPEMSRVKAWIGITLLHRGITHGLGFEQLPVNSGMFERLTMFYLRLLLSVMHPEGRKRIGRCKEKLVPLMLVHTRNSLRQRFMPDSPVFDPSHPGKADAHAYH